MRNKLQVTQNKCVSFCLKLKSRQHIGAKELKEINWLLTKRVEQRVATTIFKYWKRISPLYLNELFSPSLEVRITLVHIWLWRCLWKKVTYIKRAFHLLDHLFGTNWAITWKFEHYQFIYSKFEWAEFNFNDNFYHYYRYQKTFYYYYFYHHDHYYHYYNYIPVHSYYHY